jgi:hypothetical protein
LWARFVVCIRKEGASEQVRRVRVNDANRHENAMQLSVVDVREECTDGKEDAECKEQCTRRASPPFRCAP